MCYYLNNSLSIFTQYNTVRIEQYIKTALSKDKIIKKLGKYFHQTKEST